MLEAIPGFLFLGWLGCLGLGCYVAAEKRRSVGEGFFLAFFFGPFGVLIAALLPTQQPVERTPAVLPSPATMAWMPGPRPAPRPTPPPLPAERPLGVVGDDGIVRWTCRCGHYRTAPAALAGRREICPKCRTREVVPGDDLSSRAIPPKPAAAPPPAPKASVPVADFEDEDGINDAQTLEFLAEMESKRPGNRRSR